MNGNAGSKEKSAPEPDDDRKPDSVKDLTGPARKFILKKTLREFSKDQCLDLAAALTYYAVLALFPALLAVVSLLSLFGQSKSGTRSLSDLIKGIAPGAASSTVQGVLTQLTQQPAAGLGVLLGLAGALWSASAYVGAFSRAMNRIYEVEEGRPFWKLRPMMILITLIAVVLAALVAVGLIMTGPVARSIGDALGIGTTAVLIFNIAKWPVLLAIVVLIVAILYYATPNVRQPKFRWISMGAAAAVMVWIIASLLFGIYVANFGNYDKTYGSLVGVIVFLLWLWITNLALLFGAEIDSEVERGRQLQAGIPAEEELQLPARDTRVIDKTAAKDEQHRKEAAELRATGGASAKVGSGAGGRRKR